MSDDYQLFKFQKSPWSDKGEIDLQITKSPYSSSSIAITLTPAQLHQLAVQIRNEIPHDASCEAEGCDL